jgi:hypothetical protein
MKVIAFGCGPWRWCRGVGEIHINMGRVGEERGGKEMDRCPLTGSRELAWRIVKMPIMSRVR